LGHWAVLLFLSGLRRIILVLGFLGALLAQLKVLGPSLDEGLYAGVALTESGEGRQNHHRICWQMMRLEAVVFQEVPEEVTHRESEPSLKVGDKDHPLGGLRCRDSFTGR
jgi:hypothetical protein